MEKKSFISQYKRNALISLAIIVVAVILTVCGLGMNMGIDFTGGSLLQYNVGSTFEVADVEAALTAVGVNNAQIAKSGETGTELQIRTVDLGESADDLRAMFEEKMVETYPDFTFVNLSTVGAVAGRDLISNAVKSCLIVFVCLLIYIGIRFTVLSGLAALIGLLHDILIMCAFMAFFRSFYQVNSSFVAAMLTIIGYSINNTIIVFDRIRENEKRGVLRDQTKMALVEHSVRETLTRTINTTITTLFTLVTVYVLGVDSIREFTFPLLVGMLAGVYSSLLVSGQTWATWRDNDSFAWVRKLFHKEKTAQTKKAKASKA